MEFIAALRASPNYTFFPPLSCSILLSSPLFLPHLHSFSPVLVMVALPILAPAVRQVRTAHYRPKQAGIVGMPAHKSAITALCAVT